MKSAEAEQTSEVTNVPKSIYTRVNRVESGLLTMFWWSESAGTSTEEGSTLSFSPFVP